MFIGTTSISDIIELNIGKGAKAKKRTASPERLIAARRKWIVCLEKANIPLFQSFQFAQGRRRRTAAFDACSNLKMDFGPPANAEQQH